MFYQRYSFIFFNIVKCTVKGSFGSEKELFPVDIVVKFLTRFKNSCKTLVRKNKSLSTSEKNRNKMDFFNNLLHILQLNLRYNNKKLFSVLLCVLGTNLANSSFNFCICKLETILRYLKKMFCFMVLFLSLSLSFIFQLKGECDI